MASLTPPATELAVSPASTSQPQGDTVASLDQSRYQNTEASATELLAGPPQRSPSFVMRDNSEGTAKIRECRICLLSEDPEDLVSPCGCSGTMKFAHMHCLQSWAVEKKSLTCELCGQAYQDHVREKLGPLVAEAEARSTMEMEQRGQLLAMVPGEQPRIPLGKLWLHILFVLVLVVAVLYMALFVNLSDDQTTWVVVLWRMLIVVLPLLLIGRILLLMCTWRRRVQQYEEARLDRLATAV